MPMLRSVVCALSMSGWLSVCTLATAQFPGGMMGGPPAGNYPASFPAPNNPANFPAPADAQAYNQALNPQVPPTAAPQQRQLIVDVQILGVDQTREHLVQKHLHTRKDREFDPELVQSDVRRLVTSGLFRDVKTYTRQVPQGVIVIYEIFERPRIRHIKHIGNRGLSEKKLAKEHGLKVGDPLNAYSAEEGRRKIEELYHKNGYPKTQVSIMEGDKPTDKGLVYFINEGNLERIESVSFRGNTVASDSRLKTQIESKPGFMYYFFGGKVSREKLDSDVEKLTAYYRRLGYFRARVAREIELDDAGKWINLSFVIDEGPRYVVRSVKIEGIKNFPEEPLLGFMDIKPGEYFHQDKMNKDVSTLTDLYGSKGYVFADVQADPRFLEEPGQLDLVYRVQEGEVFHISDINVHIAGEFPHTRDSVILNRMGLRPGDLADMRQVRLDEARLKRSQLFETNPQQGEAPKIVLGTPNVGGAVGSIAKKPSKSTIRGQTPEATPELTAQPRPMQNQPYVQAPPYAQPQPYAAPPGNYYQPPSAPSAPPYPYVQPQFPEANRR